MSYPVNYHHMIEPDIEESSPPGCLETATDCAALPDACTNEIREERLIQRQDVDDDRTWIRRLCERDRNLVIACIILVICLNWTTGWYLLYPFRIFSTWVHEMCHAVAAWLVGGSIRKLEVYQDGSGLAYTSVNSAWKRGFVAFGGYPGTAITGCFLLLFRRTTLGPTIGTVGFGVLILLSCACWVRNQWGLWALLVEGLSLVFLGWRLPAHFLDQLYNFLAATCCLNAISSIQDLFATSDYYVGGQVVTTSDAHTVAEKWGMTYRFWAITWLWMSFLFTVVGILFALDAKKTTWYKSPRLQNMKTPRMADDGVIVDAIVEPVYRNNLT
eukprot:Nitzschia sp. Nitz4//scaffold37_size175936//158670//159656//NITZ4_002067-RA/size175936-processed-gene-0.234-mRNA-1//-1//CDS//3329549851//1083//frame0